MTSSSEEGETDVGRQQQTKAPSEKININRPPGRLIKESFTAGQSARKQKSDKKTESLSASTTQ